MRIKTQIQSQLGGTSFLTLYVSYMYLMMMTMTITTIMIMIIIIICEVINLTFSAGHCNVRKYN